VKMNESYDFHLADVNGRGHPTLWRLHNWVFHFGCGIAISQVIGLDSFPNSPSPPPLGICVGDDNAYKAWWLSEFSGQTLRSCGFGASLTFARQTDSSSFSCFETSSTLLNILFFMSPRILGLIKNKIFTSRKTT